MKTKLLAQKITPAQGLIIGAWYANLLLVVIVWVTTSGSFITEGDAGGIFLAIGRLFGLLAATFALTQFMLMGRILWIERRFGLDHLAAYHRLNGYAAISFMLLHAPMVVLGYSLSGHTNYVRQYIEVIAHYQYAWWAFIAQLLFLLMVASSVYIVRRRLKFETWYYVHLLAYAAIILVFFHQLAIGGSFLGHPLARIYWYAVYGFVAINILFWRFTLPSLNLIRFNFHVSKVVAETTSTTSVYIAGRGLHNWPAQAGQFVLVRFLNLKFGLQEHPFSLSALPEENQFRLTIRHSGDYTNAINQLKIGTKVLVSGPFGRFTSEIAHTHKRLFIAGGVGITPIRTLAEQALAAGQDSVLLYGNRTPNDVVFEEELAGLAKRGLKIVQVFSDPTASRSEETGYITSDLIKEIVPDYKERDVYLCGPPPMMADIIDGLTGGDLSPSRLHYERFALHP